MKFGGLWIFMEFQIINVFMSIYSVCQLHFDKPFGFLCSWKHLPRFWNAPKCWEHNKKRVDGSGQQCRSAFDITDQRDVFLSISSDPTWIPWYFEEKLCADGFLWRRKPDIFWVAVFLTKTFWYMSLLAVWFPIYSTVTLSSQNVPWGSEMFWTFAHGRRLGTNVEGWDGLVIPGILSWFNRLPIPPKKSWQDRDRPGSSLRVWESFCTFFSTAYTPKDNMEPKKLVVCRCFSFSRGIFSGFRGVKNVKNKRCCFSCTLLTLRDLMRRKNSAPRLVFCRKTCQDFRGGGRGHLMLFELNRENGLLCFLCNLNKSFPLPKKKLKAGSW